MDFRGATPTDIPSTTRIHNDAVLNTTAIWNEAEVDDPTWSDGRAVAGLPMPSGQIASASLASYTQQEESYVRHH